MSSKRHPYYISWHEVDQSFDQWRFQKLEVGVDEARLVGTTIADKLKDVIVEASTFGCYLMVTLLQDSGDPLRIIRNGCTESEIGELVSIGFLPEDPIDPNLN